ncbi:MAG: DNA translocase FtsK 4TM domain-containing protein, partial [Candidatus Actinomarina sp.]|nr:DNA translocase FtsK 4TM domain-containing protein [Candidatus Actinomarina sp.]
KQNNLIKVNKGFKTLNSTLSSVLKKFFNSYQSVAAFMFIIALFTALSSVQKAGPIGELFYGLLTWCFGYGALALPVLMFYGAAILVRDKDTIKSQKVLVGTFWVQIFSSALFHFYIHPQPLPISVGGDILQRAGGFVSAFIVFPLNNLIDVEMTHAVLLIGLIISVLYMTDIELKDLIGGVQAIFAYIFKFIVAFFKARREASKVNFDQMLAITDEDTETASIKDNVLKLKPKKKEKAIKKKPEIVPEDKPVKANTVKRKNSAYKLPPVSLLEKGSSVSASKKLLQQTATDLTNLLKEHDVEAELTNIVPGPTVTRYEIELAPGVKVSKVTSLSHDIAYALATPDVRLLAPIPGRSAIGIEIPNRQRKLVSLGDVLQSTEAKNNPHPLSVGLGLDISGKARLINLSELPHVLIAGQTGAGKSSCINSIVTSLLVRANPDEVKMVMVDPKRVELGQYNNVPHLLTKVITNPKKAVDALSWAVSEMDRRYDLLADSSVRDINGYHEKYDAGLLDEEKFDRFPYIVVFIDELNDLMMVAGREVESAIVRLAQMARAIGIHLVVATQRPSVDVITGVMKANIPSRLAFSVASTTDSRVILDQSGAEKLIGLGDMLVVTASNPRLERIQGAWVTEKEIQDVVSWAKDQKDAEYDPAVTEENKTTTTIGGDDFGEDEDLIQAAKDLVIRSQMGSTSMLQRKLRVGFARAGRLMDILESQAIVGPSEGSKARTVLITVEEYESTSLPSIAEDNDATPQEEFEPVAETEDSVSVESTTDEEDNSWYE